LGTSSPQAASSSSNDENPMGSAAATFVNHLLLVSEAPEDDFEMLKNAVEAINEDLFHMELPPNERGEPMNPIERLQLAEQATRVFNEILADTRRQDSREGGQGSSTGKQPGYEIEVRLAPAPKSADREDAKLGGQRLQLHLLAGSHIARNTKQHRPSTLQRPLRPPEHVVEMRDGEQERSADATRTDSGGGDTTTGDKESQSGGAVDPSSGSESCPANTVPKPPLPSAAEDGSFLPHILTYEDQVVPRHDIGQIWDNVLGENVQSAHDAINAATAAGSQTQGKTGEEEKNGAANHDPASSGTPGGSRGPNVKNDQEAPEDPSTLFADERERVEVLKIHHMPTDDYEVTTPAERQVLPVFVV
ncbi:unnamed protein product, partial [Amoebophrya sp. A25]